MAVPSKDNKALIEYNIKNAVYSVDGETVKPLGFAVALALQRNQETKDIYGDGSIQASIITNKGQTGNLDLTARDEDFEKDLGMMLDIDGGLADVSTPTSKSISIGAEVYIMGKDKQTKVKKCWWFNVTVGAAGETYNQNTNTINEANASYPLTVSGVLLKDNAGSGTYKDAVDGMERLVYKMTSKPLDAGYATFLDSVPTPKAKA